MLLALLPVLAGVLRGETGGMGGGGDVGGRERCWKVEGVLGEEEGEGFNW